MRFQPPLALRLDPTIKVGSLKAKEWRPLHKALKGREEERHTFRFPINQTTQNASIF